MHRRALLALVGLFAALVRVTGQSPAPIQGRALADAPVCDPAGVEAVVACASRYIVGLERDLASVVGNEEYSQSGTLRGRDVSVTLRSDFLIVKNPAGPGWLPFRDVFEANGKPIRDRNERLARLFLERPRTALEDARRIMDEGARFNLGPFRNVNVPTIALTFLEPARLKQMTVRKTGEKGIDRTLCWTIDFREIGQPTVVQSPGNENVPASGTFWIDPNTGRLLQTFLEIPYRGLSRQETTVTFRNDARLNTFVPFEMTERFTAGNQVQLRGRASYSNFKRFAVDTSQTIKPQ